MDTILHVLQHIIGPTGTGTTQREVQLVKTLQHAISLFQQRSSAKRLKNELILDVQHYTCGSITPSHGL